MCCCCATTRLMVRRTLIIFGASNVGSILVVLDANFLHSCMHTLIIIQGWNVIPRHNNNRTETQEKAVGSLEREWEREEEKEKSENGRLEQCGFMTWLNFETEMWYRKSIVWEQKSFSNKAEGENALSFFIHVTTVCSTVFQFRFILCVVAGFWNQFSAFGEKEEDHCWVLLSLGSYKALMYFSNEWYTLLFFLIS